MKTSRWVILMLVLMTAMPVAAQYDFDVWCPFEDQAIGAEPFCEGVKISVAEGTEGNLVVIGTGEEPGVFGAANCVEGNMSPEYYSAFCGGAAPAYFHPNNCLDDYAGQRVNNSIYGDSNGGYAQGFAFLPEQQSMHVVFEFDRPIRLFVIKMFDFGDYMINSESTPVEVKVEARGLDGTKTIATDVLQYTVYDKWNSTNPKTWSGGDNLWVQGDACTAAADKTEPGYFKFQLWAREGQVMDRVEIQVIGGVGRDSKSAFDSLYYKFDPTFDLDVKPGSYPSCFNINGTGTVPVAVLGGQYGDVTQIDPSTLEFEGLAVATKKKGPQCAIEDVSGDFSATLEGEPDGYPDLVCHFDDSGSWTGPMERGTHEGCVTGSFWDSGARFEVCDEICLTQDIN